MRQMLCARPVAARHVSGRQLVGCGQCQNCLTNKKRVWTGRILLEGRNTENTGGEVSFITLTYREGDIPRAARGDGAAVSTLRPHDVQLFNHRMRKQLGGFRFHMCGEYGDQKARPHYHALVFGPRVLDVEDYCRADWGVRYGGVKVYPWDLSSTESGHALATKRAQYLARYVTKKRTRADAPWLGERYPEYSRMSRNPGIGFSNYLVALHLGKDGSRLLSETGDVAYTVRIHGRKYPLGSSLRSWLREQLGVPPRKEDRLPSLQARPEASTLDYEKAAEAEAKAVRRMQVPSHVAIGGVR